MNIIIDSKYASVYAAVHSSVWEAVSRTCPAFGISCQASEFLIRQVVMMSVISCQQLETLQYNSFHAVCYTCYILTLSQLCLSALGLLGALAKGEKKKRELMINAHSTCTVNCILCAVSILPRELAAHCLCCAFVLKLIHQAKDRSGNKSIHSSLYTPV